MKKFLVRGLTALLLVAGLTIVASAFFAPDFSITIPEAQARETLAKQIPMTIERSGATVIIKDASLDFLDSNKVALTASFDAEGFSMKGDGTLAATSGLRFSDGNFYLADLNLDDITITPAGETAQRLSDGKTLAGALMARARDHLAKDDGAIAESFDRIAAEKKSQIEAFVIDQVNHRLATTPVYSLNDKGMKEAVAAKALKEIRFTADTAEVTLSPAKALRYVLGGILIVAFAGLLAAGMMLGGGGGVLALVALSS